MNFNLFDDLDDRVIYNKNFRVPETSIRQDMPDNFKYDGNTSPFPPQTPLGMAYVPFQQWGSVYEINDAFPKGTLFPELDFPFMRGGSGSE